MPEKRILLVEDEATTQQLLANVLRREGYSIDVAPSLAEAMNLAGRQSYDLAIVDWRLPDGDGLLVADRAADLGAKTLVMSGYLFQMPARRARRHETLMKPLRPSEILEAVERSIGKAEVG
jgi:two-component system response regulator HydG